MPPVWAIAFSESNLALAGRLRHLPGVEVCEREGGIWLRGTALDDELNLVLRALPGVERFAVQSGELIAFGRRVPLGRLPAGPWLPLEEWLDMELEAASLAGRPGERIRLQIVRSNAAEQPATLLLADGLIWAKYAASAPQARLDRWQFAADEHGRVTVRGTPLPPIPGTPYCEDLGIALPAGFCFAPAVEHGVVREMLQLESNALALFHPDGSWERIPADSFVRASRSAARQLTSVSNLKSQI